MKYNRVLIHAFNNEDMVKKFLIIILAVLLFVEGMAQQDKADSAINSIMQRLEVVGLSVVVVKDNKIIFGKAYGYKDLENQIALKETDLFRIASISKSFSATTVMKLVQRGKLSLDADFGKLIGFPIRNPKYPEKVITLKMVLSHTSSINDSQGYFNLDVINPEKNKDWAKCYNEYAPGEGYQYCNLNFNMTGAVLERVTGTRFDDLIRREVIEPLGLYAGYNVDSLDREKFALLYEKDSTTGKYLPASAAYISRSPEITKYIMGYTTPIFSPTGGMKISSVDLAKYMLMHMNYGKKKSGSHGRILSKKSAKLMQTAIDLKSGYGLALWTTDKIIPGVKLVGHTGSAYGVYSAMFFDPKKKFGFVVITNGCKPVYTEGTNEVLRSTMNVLYEDIIKPR
jgi:CubicO group peptidase (beta-lactamase class C family)